MVDPAVAAEDRREAVARMCAAMNHRGPDDGGEAEFATATLGMRRLAIFDPANGRQPMRSPDGRFTIVFNGAIYNFRALRAELTADWVFRTECDTEVLLAAFARWGERCLERLRGMFAFAIWDARENALFLARDPFGIKPLYYRHDGARLIFASELNALLASGRVRGELDPLSVADYLAWFAVPAPRTIYRDIFSLRPGECATFANGRLTVRSAWSFRSVPASLPRSASREEFQRGLRAQLEDTIRAHVIADVPVGAFLSGGLDSAAVVGLMSRVSGSRLRTFSIDFEEAAYSEAASASEVARHFGTEHHTTTLTGATVARDLERLLATFDQPTGDGINTYYASQAARQGGVTVALSGLGGDELFGGYPSFRTIPRLSRWLPVWRAVPAPLRRQLLARFAHGDTRQRKLADFLAHARNPHELGALQRRVFSETSRRTLLGPDVLLALGQPSPFHPALPAMAADLDATDVTALVSAWELRTYMADLLLRDSDVMSMRHSLELRVPFVDRPLIEWLWRQPSEFKFDPRRPKSALADALADVLPPELAHRRKWGFTLPFAIWMKRELRGFLEETFSDVSVNRSGLFAAPAVQQLWRGFLTGHDTREWSRVWSLAVMIQFANRSGSAVATSPRASPAAEIANASVASVPPDKARPRTLLLAPEIFASEGGIPRILQLYLRALCENGGHAGRVRLLALNDPPSSTVAAQRCGNSAIEESFMCGRSKAQFVRAALRMSRGCDRLVCGHVAQLPVAWLARKRNPGLRYYLVAHGIEVWKPFTLAERVALRGAEKIFCVSDYTRRELLKHCPLPDGRAVVLHNALDPRFEIRPGKPLAECAPVILVVTRLLAADRYKGVQHMIEAMPAIRSALPGATLRIVGRGDDQPRLQALATHLGMSDAVTFTGFIDDGQLQRELNECRLFALPSRKEGFGLVFLEAMAHGRPCLGARAGGVPEVISADAGVLVDYGDVTGIAQASIAALQRPWDERAILARAEHFSYAHFKLRLGQLLAA